MPGRLHGISGESQDELQMNRNDARNNLSEKDWIECEYIYSEALQPFKAVLSRNWTTTALQDGAYRRLTEDPLILRGFLRKILIPRDLFVI